ncbi:hypothetical protein B566_EDAN014001, partial [Ephemera danica]
MRDALSANQHSVHTFHDVTNGGVGDRLHTYLPTILLRYVLDSCSHLFPVIGDEGGLQTCLYKLILILNMQCLKREAEIMFTSCIDFCKMAAELAKPKEELEAAKADMAAEQQKNEPVPYAKRERVHETLQQLVRDGAIAPIKSSPWATPTVNVEKADGSIRVCGDYSSTVNPCCNRDVDPMPSVNEILTNLSGGKVFAKLDLALAYLQIAVDDETSLVLTINTTLGLFKVLRLSAGLSSAPAIFQRTLVKLLSGFQNTAIYYDDVFVKANSEEELIVTLRKVLEVFKRVGLRLKEKKCFFCVSELDVLGYRFAADGLRPADSKVQDLLMMRPPQNKDELQSLLGYINYYDRFLKDRASIFAPLYKLLECGTKWAWHTEHQNALNYVKQVMCSDTALVHYSEKLPLVLACNASPYGVGAVLSHIMEDGSERPIAHSSRTLRDSEKNYAQIDREGLSVVFCVRKFHMYLYGRQFVIYTDHKPLLGLFRPDKPMPDILSPRIIRWALLLSNYNHMLQFRAGKQHANADLFSRLPRTLDESNETYPEPGVVLLLDDTRDTSPISVSKVEDATRKDAVLPLIYSTVVKGGDFASLPETCAEYLRQPTALSVSKGCLLLGHRVIIPLALRKSVLEQLHKYHQGITKLKLIARSYVWWPNIDKDIEFLCKSCDVRNAYAKAPPKAAVVQWSTPLDPWRRIHIDFAGPETHGSYSASTAINALRIMFSTHGIPDELVSDNAPAYRALEFLVFIERNMIVHHRVAPYQPASNGSAERAVQTVKSMLAKFDHQFWKIQLPNILLALRSTPCASTGRSPAQMMFGRNIRTLFDKMHPHTATSDATRNAAALAAQHATTPSRDINAGDIVWYRNYRGEPKWEKGIVSVVLGPRNFKVRTVEGHVIDRHIDQLRKGVASLDGTPSNHSYSHCSGYSDVADAESIHHDSAHTSDPFNTPPQSPQSSSTASSLSRSTSERSPSAASPSSTSSGCEVQSPRREPESPARQSPSRGSRGRNASIGTPSPKQCQFDNINQALLSQVITGKRDKYLEEEIVQIPDLTYEKCLRKAQSAEAAHSVAQQLHNTHAHHGDGAASLHKISHRRKQQSSAGQQQSQQWKESSKNQGNTQRPCFRCDRSNHRAEECHFKNSTCSFCSKLGHIE